MGLLLLKLTVTPAAIGLASVIGRRWGPAVGGWMAGIPFTSGPLTLFLALERGAAFAAAAAVGVLGGTASQAAFALAYAWVALRGPWSLALAAASVAFAACTAGLHSLQLTELPALEIVIGAIVLSLALMPGTRSGQTEPAALEPQPAPPGRAPWLDIAVRMVVATAVVLLLTAIAPSVGPVLAGLISPYPLFAAVLIVFPHHSHGADAAIAACRGFLWGLLAFASFGAVLASLLQIAPLAFAFVLALAATIAVQAMTLVVLRRWPKLAGGAYSRSTARRRSAD